MKGKKKKQEKQQKLGLDECLVCLTENSHAVYCNNHTFSLLSALKKYFIRITRLLTLDSSFHFVFDRTTAMTDILIFISCCFQFEVFTFILENFSKNFVDNIQ